MPYLDLRLPPLLRAGRSSTAGSAFKQPGGSGTLLPEPEDRWVLPADRFSPSTARKAASLYVLGLERDLLEAEPVAELEAGVEPDVAGIAFGGGPPRGAGIAATPITLYDSAV